MSEPPTGHDPAAADDPVAQAIAEALRIEPLDEAALARMHATVLDEWRRGIAEPARRPRRRAARWLGLTAAACVALLAAVALVRPTGTTAVVGVLVRLESGSIDAAGPFWRHRAIRVGEPVRSGETLEVHGPALLSLARGGSLRLAADSVLELASGADVRLERGLVYVDIPPGGGSAAPFRVRTRVGTVEHLGTQFEVLSSNLSVRIRVREGRVRLVGPAGAAVATAGTEVVASVQGGLSQRSIETYGRDWLWVAALAPDYAIEGRSLAEFLQWVSRELGRSVEYADPRAGELAARTILHGSLSGRDPLDALTEVLASTSLAFELRGEAIRIRSGS